MEGKHVIKFPIYNKVIDPHSELDLDVDCMIEEFVIELEDKRNGAII